MSLVACSVCAWLYYPHDQHVRCPECGGDPRPPLAEEIETVRKRNGVAGVRAGEKAATHGRQPGPLGPLFGDAPVSRQGESPGVAREQAARYLGRLVDDVPNHDVWDDDGGEW